LTYELESHPVYVEAEKDFINCENNSSNTDIQLLMAKQLNRAVELYCRIAYIYATNGIKETKSNSDNHTQNTIRDFALVFDELNETMSRIESNPVYSTFVEQKEKIQYLEDSFDVYVPIIAKIARISIYAKCLLDEAAIKPVESANETMPTTEPTKPVLPANEPTESTELTEPTEPTEPIESTELTESTKEVNTDKKILIKEPNRINKSNLNRIDTSYKCSGDCSCGVDCSCEPECNCEEDTTYIHFPENMCNCFDPRDGCRRCYLEYKECYNEHQMYCKLMTEIPKYNKSDNSFMCPCGFVTNEFFDNCGCRLNHICEACVKGQMVVDAGKPLTHPTQPVHDITNDKYCDPDCDDCYYANNPSNKTECKEDCSCDMCYWTNNKNNNNCGPECECDKCNKGDYRAKHPKTQKYGYPTLSECNGCIYKSLTDYEPYHQFLHAVNVELNGWIDVWYSLSDHEQVDVVELMFKAIKYAENERKVLSRAINLICQEIPNNPGKLFNKRRRSLVLEHINGLEYYEKMICTFKSAVHKAMTLW
jgi:hypothetical protein